MPTSDLMAPFIYAPSRTGNHCVLRRLSPGGIGRANDGLTVGDSHVHKLITKAEQVFDARSFGQGPGLSCASRAGNCWARAVEEMKSNRLHVAGDFPEFIVTNKSGTAYKVKLDPHGNGSCTCPDFLVRIAQEGRICKHIAAAIIALAPQAAVSSPANGNGSVRVTETATAEASPLIFRIRRNVQTEGKGAVQVEVQARVINNEEQDRETASFACELLERLASLAGKNGAPSEANFARETALPSTAKPTLVKSSSTSTKEGSPAHAAS
jgi:SWIM zinc finger